jgi:pyruvate-ferredoxin/flavodoxin oxidoreductase
MDELERTAETPAVPSVRLVAPAKLEMLDAFAAIDLAEKAAGATIGDDLGAALAAAEKGERIALRLPIATLATMRDALRRAATARAGLVVHAIAGHGAEDLPALADLGWGVLSASGPEDSFDLTLVAHRAAEDSGVPFLVVHGLAERGSPAGRAVAMVAIPHDRAIQSFVGVAGAPRAQVSNRAASDRAFAERVPFALGAALRDYGNVSGRRHDVFDKVPLGESPLVLVGTGPVGDALFCAVGELRARGYDVGAVHLTSLRPFPGPRLVKALGRALAITVLEPADEPLTHGALLARDVKSAFTDALTWMPGFPGIGRIPKLYVGAAGSAFDLSDLQATCENMLADEHGKRIFSFVDVEHALPRAPAKPIDEKHVEREVALRFVADDAESADAILKVLGPALANGVGVRVHGLITASQHGPGAVLDVLASRTHARGGMARRAPKLVVATERGVSNAGAVVALSDGAVLAIVGADPKLPEAARTVVREKGAKVLPLTGSLAAVAAGAALAAAARVLKMPLEAGAAAQVVAEASGEAGDTARRAFEQTRDVLA